MSLKMILRNIFSYSKNSVLDFNVFCSRSVLVLNVKNFSCSCSVLVREQEQVREHVLEQLACSFIPDPMIKKQNCKCMNFKFGISID